MPALLIFSIQNDGSGFKVLHSFSAPASLPMGDLLLSDDTLYGMTVGTNTGGGTMFQMNTDGSAFQIDHTFSFSPTNLTDGSRPKGSLLLLNSKFYGMTQLGGGSKNTGALFSFDPNGTGSCGGGGGSTGALKVNLLPADAAKAGAQWMVDGAGALKSGAVFTGLAAGPHIITLKTINGWTTPAAQVVNVTADATNTATATYIGGCHEADVESADEIRPASKQRQLHSDRHRQRQCGRRASELSTERRRMDHSDDRQRLGKLVGSHDPGARSQLDQILRAGYEH